MLRRRARGDEQPLDDAALEVADVGPSPYEALLARQNAAAVRQCMQALPAAQREALHLQWVEDLKLEEIARLTAAPANTVATRIHHAKRRLRDCLLRRLDIDTGGRRKASERVTQPT